MYGLHGGAKESLQLFENMQRQGIKPNAITFVCLLNACSHTGLVEQAWSLYSCMQPTYGIHPDSRHEVCMVDVWARAGMLDKAEKFIMSIERQKPEGAKENAVLWRTLLGACHNWRDVERAQRAAAYALSFEPRDAATHVLLANTFGSAGKLREQNTIWAKMKTEEIKKIPGVTWVTVNRQTEKFYVDSEHLYLEIVAFLAITRQELISKHNYKPDVTCVLQPELSEKAKLDRLWLHSEKMALAWALLNSSPTPSSTMLTSPSTPSTFTSLPEGDTIIMHKNLRVCHDCHTALKLISKMYSTKKFIIRDANRFHHFEKGNCSCHDYW